MSWCFLFTQRTSSGQALVLLVLKHRLLDDNAVHQVSEDNSHHSSMSSSGTSEKSPCPSEDLESKTNASKCHSLSLWRRHNR